MRFATVAGVILVLSLCLGLACGPELPPAHDAGTTAHDAGAEASDAATSAADAGVETPDASTSAADAEVETPGAGSAALDAGRPTDAGSTGHDAGATVADAGHGEFDARCPGASRVITVAPSGGGDFKTIQAAVDSIPANNPAPVQIRLRPGTYAEHVDITQPHVCLTGDDAESTIITATAGTNIVTGGTVIVTGADFSAANITFENSAPNGSAQAVALMAKGSRQQFLDCRFLSYQDTLYVASGTQYFRRCYIQGSTDYIFGEATAVFEGCTVNNVADGSAIVAPRTPQSAPYGFVFLGGSLTATPTTSPVGAHRVHLGRPWGPYAAATFIGVSMGEHIAGEGWTTMGPNDLSNTRFREYDSSGPGANPTDATRAPRQLTEAQANGYTVSSVLKPWAPGYSNP